MIKFKVLILGLTVYCWFLILYAILIEKIVSLNRYEQFCVWYILSIVTTLIIFTLTKRIYFIKISKIRGYKLWKVYIPKVYVINEYQIQTKKSDYCVFVIEDKVEKNAIDFAIKKFGNQNVNVNQIKCIEYKGFRYTPYGEPEYIAFEDEIISKSI